MTAARIRPVPRGYTSSRGLDRVVFFTDAIAAIAITLLILPLVDLVPESAKTDPDPWAFMVANAPQLLSFVISFAVIARLWYAHHQIFEHVARYSGRLALLSVIWAFTVVVLPLPTALVSEFDASVFTVIFYIGTMLLSSCTLTGMALLIRGSSHLESDDNPVSSKAIAGSLTTTALFAIALAVGLFLPDVNYWALATLALSGPVSAVVLRSMRAQRHGAAHGA